MVSQPEYPLYIFDTEGGAFEPYTDWIARSEFQLITTLEFCDTEDESCFVADRLGRPVRVRINFLNLEECFLISEDPDERAVNFIRTQDEPA